MLSYPLPSPFIQPLEWAIIAVACPEADPEALGEIFVR
jgi:hypothetical protein